MNKINETFEDGLKRVLPKKISELAIKRTHHKRRKKCHKLKHDYDILTLAFNWNTTKEGLDYWHNIWIKYYEKWRRMNLDNKGELLKI